ncbi:MAG: DedA family protein [Dehalobacterium sp.]
MEDVIIDIMEQYGYLGVGLLMALENVILFIPSEVILIFGGFLTTYSNLNVWIVILFATLGSVIGALFLYGMGRLIQSDSLTRIFSGKWGHVLHLESTDIDKAGSWLNKKGSLTVFFCRFIPIVRCLISIPAGAMKMNLYVFLVLTTIGAAIWNAVLIWLGVFAGASWENIAQHMHTYSARALTVLVLIALILAVIFYNKLQKRKTIKSKENS